MAPGSTRLTRRGRIYTSLGTGAVAIGALTYVGIADPHRPDSLFPACPFKLLTGWNCPACGGLRMTHDLLHGNFSAAVVDNVFLLAGIPVLLAWLLGRRRMGKPAATPATYIVVGAAAFIWTVVRNVPGFPLVPTVYPG
ncbi:DUF2752 domain-containing protein [Mycobacterium sp.]|uniref:DUF2752 domain-containing protein n=1 Tax=Mycobacterium sp. TaxID=1785 RepID=UPI002BA4EFAF|nr:DUF2752 domain-containing protein [Mycobacterium sp.]HME50366.1 DUF2752 domain-containing protein [Mycobacterium sp.]